MKLNTPIRVDLFSEWYQYREFLVLNDEGLLIGESNSMQSALDIARDTAGANVVTFDSEGLPLHIKPLHRAM